MFIFVGAVGSIGSSMLKSFTSRKMRDIDKNDEKILNNAVRNKITQYLKENIGSAYSKDTLLKRVAEKVKHPYFKTYIKNNGEKILHKLVIEGLVLTTQKNEETHYFTSVTED
jgi:hypothetical protein